MRLRGPEGLGRTGSGRVLIPHVDEGLGAGCSNRLAPRALEREAGRTFVMAKMGNMEADSLFKGRVSEGFGAMTTR